MIFWDGSDADVSEVFLMDCERVSIVYLDGKGTDGFIISFTTPANISLTRLILSDLLSSTLAFLLCFFRLLLEDNVDTLDEDMLEMVGIEEPKLFMSARSRSYTFDGGRCIGTEDFD